MSSQGSECLSWWDVFTATQTSPRDAVYLFNRFMKQDSAFNNMLWYLTQAVLESETRNALLGNMIRCLYDSGSQLVITDDEFSVLFRCYKNYVTPDLCNRALKNAVELVTKILNAFKHSEEHMRFVLAFLSTEFSAQQEEAVHVSFLVNILSSFKEDPNIIMEFFSGEWFQTIISRNDIGSIFLLGEIYRLFNEACYPLSRGTDFSNGLVQSTGAILTLLEGQNLGTIGMESATHAETVITTYVQRELDAGQLPWAIFQFLSEKLPSLTHLSDGRVGFPRRLIQLFMCPKVPPEGIKSIIGPLVRVVVMYGVIDSDLSWDDHYEWTVESHKWSQRSVSYSLFSYLTSLDCQATWTALCTLCNEMIEQSWPAERVESLLFCFTRIAPHVRGIPECQAFLVDIAANILSHSNVWLTTMPLYATGALFMSSLVPVVPKDMLEYSTKIIATGFKGIYRNESLAAVASAYAEFLYQVLSILPPNDNQLQVLVRNMSEFAVSSSSSTAMRFCLHFGTAPPCDMLLGQITPLVEAERIDSASKTRLIEVSNSLIMSMQTRSEFTADCLFQVMMNLRNRCDSDLSDISIDIMVAICANYPGIAELFLNHFINEWPLGNNIVMMILRILNNQQLPTLTTNSISRLLEILVYYLTDEDDLIDTVTTISAICRLFQRYNSIDSGLITRMLRMIEENASVCDENDANCLLLAKFEVLATAIIHIPECHRNEMFHRVFNELLTKKLFFTDYYRKLGVASGGKQGISEEVIQLLINNQDCSAADNIPWSLPNAVTSPEFI